MLKYVFIFAVWFKGTSIKIEVGMWIDIVPMIHWMLPIELKQNWVTLFFSSKYWKFASKCYESCATSAWLYKIGFGSFESSVDGRTLLSRLQTSWTIQFNRIKNRNHSLRFEDAFITLYRVLHVQQLPSNVWIIQPNELSNAKLL